MTYSLVLLVILYGVYLFDIRHKIDYKDRYYHFVLVILILIAGLGYRMGGDGIVYMSEYPQYKINDGFGWTALTSYNGRQPAWVLLCKLCRVFTTDYWLFKLAHAVLYNSLVFYGLKRLTTHRFTAILFYFVLIYFDTNFQILRQAMAMGLFLAAVPSYMGKKWIRYYSLIALAIAFHEGAIICILFPLVRNIKIDKMSVAIIGMIFISIIVFIGPLLEMILMSYIPEAFRDKFFLYTKNIGTESAFTSYINVLLSFIIPLFYVYLRRNSVKEDVVGKGTIIYGLCYTINLYFPIFYRFSYFFSFFFYLLYIDLFYDLSYYGLTFWKKNISSFRNAMWSNSKLLTYFVLVFMFLMVKGRFYFSTYGDTGMPVWVQYYPYTSVIFKDTDAVREEFIHRL